MGRRERVEKRGLSKVVANFSRQVTSLSTGNIRLMFRKIYKKNMF